MCVFLALKLKKKVYELYWNNNASTNVFAESIALFSGEYNLSIDMYFKIQFNFWKTRILGSGGALAVCFQITEFQWEISIRCKKKKIRWSIFSLFFIPISNNCYDEIGMTRAIQIHRSNICRYVYDIMKNHPNCA